MELKIAWSKDQPASTPGDNFFWNWERLTIPFLQICGWRELPPRRTRQISRAEVRCTCVHMLKWNGEERLCSCCHNQLKCSARCQQMQTICERCEMWCNAASNILTDTSPRSRRRRKQVLDRVTAFSHVDSFMFDLTFDLMWFEKWAKNYLRRTRPYARRLNRRSWCVLRIWIRIKDSV